MGYRFTKFFRLPTSHQLPKPGSETEPSDRDDDIGNFESTESLGKSEFYPSDTCVAMEWSLMRNPIPDLPNPSYNRAQHLFWCDEEDCDECQKDGKKIKFDPMPEWHRLFFSVNAEDSGTQYYRVLDLDEQLASLREAVGQIQEFLSKLSEPLNLIIDDISITVVEYDLSDENRKIQWPQRLVENLQDFLEQAETLLKQAEEAKQQWGEEAAIYIDTDL